MDDLNPLNWTAVPFLTLYAMLATMTLCFIGAWSTRLGPRARGATDAGLGVLHLAFLAGGPERAGDAALVALLEAGAAVPDKSRGTVRFDLSVPVPGEFQPFRHVSGWVSSRERFQHEFAPRWDRLRADLAQRNLVPSDAEVTQSRGMAGAMLAMLLLLGISKVVVGIGRDKPVVFLLLFLLATVGVGAALVSQRPCRNVAGGAVLEAARRRHVRAARAPLPEEMALAFALTGAAVLAGTGYTWFLKQSSSSGGDSGCSGGDSGGGDGGGGCGGCSG